MASSVLPLRVLTLSIALWAGFPGTSDAQTPSGSPTASLTIVAFLNDGQPPTPFIEGGVLPGGTPIAFEVEGQGSAHLYLLVDLPGEAGLPVLIPASGMSWRIPNSRQRIAPLSPDQRPDEPRPDRWHAGYSDSLRFLLVAAPVPRDIASDAQVNSLEDFLAPPPFVEGQAALPALVVDSVTVSWAHNNAHDEDEPTERELQDEESGNETSVPAATPQGE